MEEGIPITDPKFYSSELLCPDSMIEYVFRPVAQSSEIIPLLSERISIMREVGSILCTVRNLVPASLVVIYFRGRFPLYWQNFGGSFQCLVEEFHQQTHSCGTAIQLVQMVANTFPSFQDETWLDGQKGNFVFSSHVS